MKKYLQLIIIAAWFLSACNTSAMQSSGNNDSIVKPVIVTEKVFEDSDDPAIWINKNDLSQSLIIGTDKSDANGGLYVFGLSGKINRQLTVTGLKRMNNVDIAYGLPLGNNKVDIAVATERGANSIRVFSMPGMKPLDGGGIEVFKNETERAPMGIALYTRPADGKIFAIVSRKSGPAQGYLQQYVLHDDGSGKVVGDLVRSFGAYSGKKEIESVAVDNELGFVYYSDEQTGIRKYYADPEKGNAELALFGQGEYKEDNEGISIYKLTDSTGYILVSDQSANRFNIYPREGNEHKRITSVAVSTSQSDGSDATSISLPGFEGGLFVAMSTDKTFQYYRWKDIAAKAGLKVKE
ncbi:phytase [Parafilimonas sp.]|uniref:phytase n=1 Tax=Parafilimonas sp. TaxID=1969739 RepID=UPI0039E67166